MVGFLMVLMGLAACFLIILVLIQRGRGGGLAGALGGAGGTSAFGTKAGDMFTRITIFTALIWVLLCIATTKWVSTYSNPLSAGEPDGVNSTSDTGAGGAAGGGSDDNNSGNGDSGNGGQ